MQIFAEQFPQLARPHAQRTLQLQEALCQVGMALGGQAGTYWAACSASSSSRDTILRLIRMYPEYCPYEIVLSAMTGKSIEQCREKVLWGLEEGTVDVMMRPVRNLLVRCRMKLRPFGIEIKSIVHMGYLLVPLKRTHETLM
jgi:hypothetical protein